MNTIGAMMMGAALVGLVIVGFIYLRARGTLERFGIKKPQPKP